MEQTTILQRKRKNSLNDPRILDLIALLALALAAFRLLAAVPGVYEIGLADEARYLFQGSHLLRDGLPSPQWSPLYAVWYFLVQTLLRISHGAQLYLTSFALLSALNPLAIYIYLRRLMVKPVIALPVSFLFLVSFSNLEIMPYPGKFALVLLLGFLILSTFGSERARWTSVILGLLLTSYVRPEYYTSFLLAVAILGLYALVAIKRRGRSEWRRWWPNAVLIALIALVLFAVVGNPLAGGRSLTAFRQHFALNYVNANEIDIDPWANFVALSTEAFGDADSIGASMLANPQMFLMHLLRNAPLYLKRLVQIALMPTMRPWLVSARSAQAVTILMAALAGVALLLAIGMNFVQARKRTWGCARWVPPAFCSRPNGPNTGRLAFVTLVVMATTTVSALLIYPRDHYLQLPAVLMTLLASVFVSNTLDLAASVRLPAVWRPAGLLAVAAACFVMTPNLSTGFLWAPVAKGEIRRDIFETVQLVQDMDITVPTTVLVPNRWGYSFNAYLDDHLAVLPPTEKTAGFEQFLTNRSLGVVIWPERVAADPLFKDDREFAAFMGDLGGYGFVAVPVPLSRGERTVLVRRDLLDPAYSAPVPSGAVPTQATATPTQAPAPTPQGDHNAQLAQAEKLAAAGQFEQAIVILRSLADTMPGDRGVQMALARTLAASGAGDEAIMQYRLINERWPDFPWAYVQQGQLLFNLGKTDEAIAALENAVQVAPDQADTHFVLGGIYKRTGRRDEAIVQFQLGLAIDPNRAAAIRDLDELMAAPSEP